jgi:hypothetical protein
MTIDSKESALSRWSRRKTESKDPVAPAVLTLENDDQNSIAVTEPEQAPELTDADMPDIETLTEESDFSGFMSSGVSDDLRNLALRKLFKSSVFNIRDGLDEYDEDYTEFEKLGDIVTCDMKHQIEMQEQKLREKLAAEADADGVEAEDDESITAVEDESIEAVEDDADAAESDDGIEIAGAWQNESKNEQ